MRACRLAFLLFISLSIKSLSCSGLVTCSGCQCKRQTGAIAATGDDEPAFPSAEGALARSIRQKRANRGRVAAPTTTSRKKRTATKRKKKQPKVLPQKRKTIKSKGANGVHLPYESAIEALRTYHSIHSNLVIPRRYTIPYDSSDYSSDWHGIDLAGTVYNMKWWQRHVRQNPDRVAELNKLGFIWERLQPEWNLILEALITYSALEGDVLVPTKFVVPHDSPDYPKATWGLALGNCVFRIRSRNDFLRGNNSGSRRAQLDGLGFVWDVTDHLFRKFYTGLRLFQQLEQEESTGLPRVLRVPTTFVVPSSSKWPKEFWGYRLGDKCSAVRQKQLYIKNDPERQRALAELGFQWSSGNATLGWLEVVHAAAIYSRMNNRNLDVPYHFVVPAPPHIEHTSSNTKQDCITGSDDAWPWPEQLWGLPLGQRLKDIRLKGAYLSGSTGRARRAQLDALGFNWTPKRGRPRKSVDS